jgi:anti-sigma B factor antagonist
MSAGPAGASVPPLSLRIAVEGDVTLVYCSGKLTAGQTGTFRDEVKPLLVRSKKVVLNLAEVSQMDSMGLGTILSLYVSAKTAGCQLEMVHLSERVRELFRITNLLSHFDEHGEHIIRTP